MSYNLRHYTLGQYEPDEILESFHKEHEAQNHGPPPGRNRVCDVGPLRRFLDDACAAYSLQRRSEHN